MPWRRFCLRWACACRSAPSSLGTRREASMKRKSAACAAARAAVTSPAACAALVAASCANGARPSGTATTLLAATPLISIIPPADAIPRIALSNSNIFSLYRLNHHRRAASAAPHLFQNRYPTLSRATSRSTTVYSTSRRRPPPLSQPKPAPAEPPLTESGSARPDVLKVICSYNIPALILRYHVPLVRYTP